MRGSRIDLDWLGVCGRSNYHAQAAAQAEHYDNPLPALVVDSDESDDDDPPVVTAAALAVSQAEAAAAAALQVERQLPSPLHPPPHTPSPPSLPHPSHQFPPSLPSNGQAG